MSLKRVIIVTDGDCLAGKAVERAAANVGGRCISLSACHVPGDQWLGTGDLVELTLSSPSDLVVVMVDDSGNAGRGRGENLLKNLVENDQIEVLGVVAVASNTDTNRGVRVDASITRHGEVVEGPVGKDGEPKQEQEQYGDTVGVLRQLDVPVIIGLGDPGKMCFADDVRNGAPVTTKALQEVLARAQGGDQVSG